MKNECCNHDCGQSDRCPRRLAGEVPERGYRLILLLWILVAAVVCVAMTGCVRRDATDPAGGYSGMELFTDSETGCQYVGFGGEFGKALTPRMAADGVSQMGCKGVKP